MHRFSHSDFFLICPVRVQYTHHTLAQCATLELNNTQCVGLSLGLEAAKTVSVSWVRMGELLLLRHGQQQEQGDGRRRWSVKSGGESNRVRGHRDGHSPKLTFDSLNKFGTPIMNLSNFPTSKALNLILSFNFGHPLCSSIRWASQTHTHTTARISDAAAKPRAENSRIAMLRNGAEHWVWERERKNSRGRYVEEKEILQNHQRERERCNRPQKQCKEAWAAEGIDRVIGPRARHK